MSNTRRRRAPRVPDTQRQSASLPRVALTAPPARTPPPPDADSEVSPAADQDGGRLQAFVDRNAPEVVGVTYLLEPADLPGEQAVTLRLTGRRLNVTGRRGPGDEFVRDETVEHLVAGCGPVSVTAKIRDVQPGEWSVNARMLPASRTDQRARPADRGQPAPVRPAQWSWRHWRASPAPAAEVQTRLAPLVKTPAVIIGSWPALVVLGIVAALLTQSLVIRAEHLGLGHVWLVSGVSVLVGAIGAKAWYMVLHRREHLADGWAVQGLVTGVAVSAPLMLALLNVPIGTYLDATAPALMFGMAIGRWGCFLTGCCAGRTTGSRFGVWSSNRRVGARRIPAQPLESILALIVGVSGLVTLLGGGPRHGAIFVATLAAYTIVRQAVLLLREERRQSRVGPRLIASIAALALVADIAVSAAS